MPDTEDHSRAEEMRVLATWALNADVAALRARAAESADPKTAALLEAFVAHRERDEEVGQNERRLIEAQRIAHVGSYDFEIATNTNTWSDELYRIYGQEPQSFNASYERFLELVHPDDHAVVIGAHQRALERIEPFQMEERILWPDGQVRTLASWGEVLTDDEGRPTRMVGICWDVTERKVAEELAMRFHDDQVRRRHALEINDTVVQGLTSVLYLLEMARPDVAREAAVRTLASARVMMTDLLGAVSEGSLEPGALVRSHAHARTLHELVPDQAAAPAGALRLVLVDDAEDIRLLLRYTLTTTCDLDIVAEAGDGEQAVRAAAEHQPDAIVLDLAMPVMDGLQAIPEIRRVSPRSRIIVLSGFHEDVMKARALELGADSYVEKGEATAELIGELDRLFPGRTVLTAAAGPPPTDPSAPSETEDIDVEVALLVHELRTPLTVIHGMLDTLLTRSDSLPSPLVQELLEVSSRNARQMIDLLDGVTDARRVGSGMHALITEPVDLATLARKAVADLVAAGQQRPMTVTADQPEVVAMADPLRVRQVLANLLSNACKFGPPGTPISVSVGEQDGLAQIAVHDQGNIPVDRRPELFRRFSRLGASGPGMGLGLYLSRAIAQAHGGDVELADGPGTTFVVRLPMYARAKAGQPPA